MGQAFAGIAVLTYYSSLLALTLYYFVVSMQKTLPWAFCREEWGPDCADSETQANFTANNTKLKSSSELYFIKVVIREVDDISDGVGTPSWQLTLGLFFSWFLTFLIIVRGVKTTGKAAYFLALFPYVVLLTLLLRAVTLEGAIDGIIFFLKPNWSELLNLNVWKAAVVQCFFSLAVGLGPIVMFSSYNKFHHNVHRDAIIVTILDTITSLIAGITIFGILGNLAHNLRIKNIGEVVRSSTGLAFISYPSAIAKFQAVPQLFAVLFFFMLFVLGIGTLVAQANTLVTILCDQFRSLNAPWVALATTVCGFFSGIIYVTPAGQWILNLVDYYGCTSVIFGLAVFQIIGVSWIYGLRNFVDDIEFMTKRSVSIYWKMCWIFFTPIFLILIFISSMVEMKTATYAGKDYPDTANIAGWTLFAIGFLQFPLWAIWVICRHSDENFYKTMKRVLSPSDEWGPSDESIRKEWLIYKSNKAEERRNELDNSKTSALCTKLKSVFK